MQTQVRTETAEYCANYSERWGVPVCVGPLDSSTQAARWTSCRFSRQGGRVLELTRVNGAGMPVAPDYLSSEDEWWTKGVARWKFSYRSDAPGTEPLLASVTMEGPTGVRLREVSFEFSDDHRQAVARFSRSFGVAERQAAEGSALGLAAVDTRLVLQQQRSGIGQHRLSFDAARLLLRRDFQPVGGGSTIPDALGSYGRAYEYGDTGLPTRIRNLDGPGNTLLEKSGIAGQLHDYDARGDLVTVAWLDSDGRLRANPQNFARFVRTYSSVGNIIGEAYYTETGAPIERADLGVARLSEKHDVHGNMVDQDYFSTDGKPVQSKLGFARRTIRYDERGNGVEAENFGADGKLILKQRGFCAHDHRLR